MTVTETTDGSNEARLEEARRCLSDAPIFDGHNDLPWALRNLAGPAGEPDPGTSLSGRTHTDIARLGQGGVGAQFWSVYVPSSLPEEEAFVMTVRQILLVYRMVERNGAHLALATTSEECIAARREGRIASFMGAEGGHCIASSLEALRALHRLGVRYMTLTHNDGTAWADSATDEPRVGGLTQFGREVVAEMNRIGMIVDLSHTSEQTMVAALETSSRPVLFTHSCAKALVDHPRNVPDAVLQRMADGGGVCQVAFVPHFVSARCKAWNDDLTQEMIDKGLDPDDHGARKRLMERFATDHPRPDATAADVADHIDHVREVAGVEHVGIGADFDGFDLPPRDLEDVAGYPRLIGELLARGWRRAEIEKLTWDNVLRVVHESCS